MWMHMDASCIYLKHVSMEKHIPASQSFCTCCLRLPTLSVKCCCCPKPEQSMYKVWVVLDAIFPKLPLSLKYIKIDVMTTKYIFGFHNGASCPSYSYAHYSSRFQSAPILSKGTFQPLLATLANSNQAEPICQSSLNICGCLVTHSRRTLPK